jgi:hypothetical protein
VASHTPRFPILATKLAEQRSERGYSQGSSPISRLSVSSVLLAVCPVLLLVGIRGGDFSLLRLLKPCGLLCSPMAKVDQREVRRISVQRGWVNKLPLQSWAAQDTTSGRLRPLAPCGQPCT